MEDIAEVYSGSEWGRVKGGTAEVCGKGVLRQRCMY